MSIVAVFPVGTLMVSPLSFLRCNTFTNPPEWVEKVGGANTAHSALCAHTFQAKHLLYTAENSVFGSNASRDQKVLAP